MESTEALLVQQLKNGVDAAYKYLYDQHYQILCHVAAQYVKDDFLAETIVGDVIFHLWEVRETIEINTSVRSYLMTCVRNRCIDYLKSQYHKREVAHSDTGLRDFPVLQYVKDDDYPLGKLLEKELEDEIMNAINRLPDECRRVFNMSRFENRKYEEIAQELKISVNTVKYHIKHALALLREDLGKYLTMAMMILIESMS
ncbi:MAG: RNA polymerase sigma-70 factor [Prevotella ruminicola]|jgi:RNA polymerase sigma-70 factor (ECF subfamily)|uniref:RNA polymerase sigma-70 factor n=1 Tax=Xylanibacter ruminicola TaxID=839 RepID=A0A928BRY5_XYLRU|nr:RNA polymerase sigma-70 factor [Xylanibacter ruminicola]